MKIQQQDGLDTDVRLDSAEEHSIYILTVLRILNYQPNVDPTTFRYIIYNLYRMSQNILNNPR